MEHSKQHQAIKQSSTKLPSIPSLLRIFSRKNICPMAEKKKFAPAVPRKSKHPMYFSRSPEPALSAIKKFPIGGQQHPMQPK